MMDIDVIIKSIKKLPPFPGLACQTMKDLDDLDAPSDQIISLVENDQFVSANVLKLCNSAYYGPARKVGSLYDGLVLLGNARLKEIILASTAAKYFEQENKGYGLAGGDLWKHAVATGIISRIISHRVTESEPLSLFTAALFHDIGKVVLNIYVDRYFEQIMGLVNTGNHSFPEAESKMIGINHAELGGKIAESWDFPDDIVRAIRLHHRPEEASPDDVITPIIYLANIITLSVGIGLGRDGLFYRGKQEIMKRYGLKAKDLQGIMVDFYDQYNAAEDLLQLA
jgi:putative nucleotidyltransferase with HDIG domain